MTLDRIHRFGGIVAGALAGAMLALVPATAGADPLLRLPEFDSLTGKASESVNITLDATLLALAARFLDPKDPQDAATREIVSGLKGIYVRSFTFDRDFLYQPADIEGVRRQLARPGWQRLVEVRSRKERSAVDIYVSISGGKADGLAIIASEPREFTIVNIVGDIDLDKLHKLEGRLGVPELDLERRPPAGNRPGR